MIQILPMVALRGLVVFPYMVLHFDVGREMSVAAIEKSIAEGQEVFLVAQKDLKIEMPELGDLYEMGTIVKVKQVLKLPGETLRVLVEGIQRARLLSVKKSDNFLEGVIQQQEDEGKDDPAQANMKEAYMRRIEKLFEKFAALGARVPGETLFTISEVHEPGKFADMVASNVTIKLEDKQNVLDQVDELARLKTVMNILEKEIEVMELDRQIASSVKQQIDKSQREYFLREQLKAIQKELGDTESDLDEIEELKKKIEELPLSEEAREKAEKELARMSKMSMSSPEVSVIRNYLDWITTLPWGVETKDDMNLKHARKILDEDHYGLDKVKDRIIEFLAVRKLKDDMKGPILCLAGPPGVGKTSIAKSVARALGKKFVRMSLGGVRDEAEIRGHRRTYIGAIPGRIITSIKQAGSVNPVFLLDEVDKMSNDFRGDPASAMLEVLDPEINNTFRDHYLDIAFDLSKVMFLTTANDISSIPGPLQDRMEIIHIDSYTDVEKLNIAKRHLIAKQAHAHGLLPKNIRISDAVIMEIIHKYTAESGVRNLEREIAAIMRKSAAKIVEDNHGKSFRYGKEPERLPGAAQALGRRIDPGGHSGRGQRPRMDSCGRKDAGSGSVGSAWNRQAGTYGAAGRRHERIRENSDFRGALHDGRNGAAAGYERKNRPAYSCARRRYSQRRPFCWGDDADSRDLRIDGAPGACGRCYDGRNNADWPRAENWRN